VRCVDEQRASTAVFQVDVASTGTFSSTSGPAGTGTCTLDSPGGQPNANQVLDSTTLVGDSQIATDLSAAIPGMAYHIFFRAGPGTFSWVSPSTIWSAGSGGTPIYTGLDGVTSGGGGCGGTITATGEWRGT
jgi:hypothetical protein